MIGYSAIVRVWNAGDRGVASRQAFERDGAGVAAEAGVCADPVGIGCVMLRRSSKTRGVECTGHQESGCDNTPRNASTDEVYTRHGGTQCRQLSIIRTHKSAMSH
jgi:hypothetical protein